MALKALDILLLITNVPSLQQILFGVPLILLTTCLLTWIITTINFHRTIGKFRTRELDPSNSSQAIPPPVLPYFIPWLGSALTFLNENPGSFWRMLRSRLSATGTNVQVCTILLGGKRAHIVNSAAAVQSLFRSKQVSRDLFNFQLATQALGTSKEDADAMFPPTGHEFHSQQHENKKDGMEALNHEFLLSQNAVNTLTAKFIEAFQDSLDGLEFETGEWKTMDLLSWMRRSIFESAVRALFGTKILEMNPTLAEQFWEYEAGFLPRMYGVPKLVKPKAYSCMDGLLDKTQAWIEYALAQHGGVAPEEPDWEPLMGSQVVRARHRYYDKIGLSSRGKAAFDLGFLFGLAGNTVPATSWLLAHLLSPETLDDVLGRVTKEVENARQPDNGVNMAVLMAQPLLNSAFTEMMRHYVDCLVTRQLKTDLVMDGYLLRKDDLIMAPSSLSQHDVFWERNYEPSAYTWYAERFMRRHDDQRQIAGESNIFSSSWAAGKYFPFGGGTHICPGRVFAKQKVLGAVTAFFLKFDVQFVEYSGKDWMGNVVGLGKDASAFPRVKQQYAGNGTLAIDGDIRVRIRRR
ncbi:hypothetical protein LTS17_000321 [Exophiala oligosperma]